MSNIEERSCLSDRAILRHMERGTIVIEPFHRANLSTSSYDVTLGEWFFRETAAQPGSTNVYNFWCEEEVRRVWGKPQQAETHAEYCARTGTAPLKNIAPDDKVIFLAPGETILAHTQQFIGGRKTVTTMMKARSSMGRNFIEVCKCAGWGDVGYVNVWTLEITNNSMHYFVPLVVGRRVAQIVFFDTEGTQDEASYELSGGKYQTSSDLVTLKKNWTPEQMLPKCYKDREIQRQNE